MASSSKLLLVKELFLKANGQQTTVSVEKHAQCSRPGIQSAQNTDLTWVRMILCLVSPVP